MLLIVVVLRSGTGACSDDARRERRTCVLRGYEHPQYQQ
jgi:hypothetical protein